jgi:hypothetical protein
LAKSLPSVALGKESSANSTSAMASLSSTFYRALNKEKRSSRRRVTETATLLSVLGDTRQRSYLCRVSTSLHLAKGTPAEPFVRFFAECSRRHSAKLASLPSVGATALGKETLPVPRCCFFAECYGPDTRQSDQYTSFLFVFSIPSKQTKDITYTSQISHNHHRYHIIITDITYTSHISQRP